jgi:dolichyl-phosphate beta-glucosyltransferase
VGPLSKTTLVIPCYNEAKRLRLSEFDYLVENKISLLFVDDGSNDGTLELLEPWCASRSALASFLRLPTNYGKGEAVRQVLLHVIPRSDIVGFADADLSTPFQEISRLCKTFGQVSPEITAILGCRVRRLGAHIARNPLRHYLGRVFASAASLVLQLPVYDTQCGAKFFRVQPALRRALNSPFHSKWIFDVELIGRLDREYRRENLDSEKLFLEMPLREWNDVKGSKITLLSFLRSSLELATIYRRLR